MEKKRRKNKQQKITHKKNNMSTFLEVIPLQDGENSFPEVNTSRNDDNSPQETKPHQDGDGNPPEVKKRKVFKRRNADIYTNTAEDS